jgi:hypothetical protein
VAIAISEAPIKACEQDLERTMAKRITTKKKDRDLEKAYSVKQTAAKLRRLADCLETGKPFQIQIAEEVEFQFTWEISNQE